MQKLKMQSADITAQNIEKIAALFPNCVTEREHNGKLEQAIDFDLLKQELSRSIVEGKQERYQLNWVGKANATVLANTPINKTLRPCREESVNFDNTENLFIEGDNLDALKLLQETYLGKVKMIYIDPPYNTGKDFIYKDNFAMENGEYQLESGQVDDEGNRLVVNSESNGRFHSDWLSMMYSRLKLARNLLTDDGVIFISIDDNEQANLKRICDEIFGEDNFIGVIPRITSAQRPSQQSYFSTTHDYILVYAKLKKFDFRNVIKRDLSQIQQDENGSYIEGDTSPILASSTQGYSAGGDYDIEFNGKIFSPVDRQGNRRRWLWTKPRMETAIKLGIIVETQTTLRVRNYIDKEFQVGSNKLVDKDPNLILTTTDLFEAKYANNRGTSELRELGISDYFDFPKGTALIKILQELNVGNNDIILDFFAGSATTAHAVMQLNAEDGGNRKFIMVQIPEKTDEKSEAHKAGYQTIAEISKERIRRAGQKIEQELADNQKPTEHLDIGFRVLKIDSSNMADIYYTPQQLQQGDMFNQVEHIKADRSEEDLLFQVLLDWGVDLTLPIDKQVINGKNVFFVDQSVLVACFDKEIDEELIKAITQYQPLRAVFRDDGFINDTTKINAEQLFKQLAPHSELRVI